MPQDLLAHSGHIAQVQGLLVGHHTLSTRPTGCTVVLCPQGATAGVDVRGAAPGTRETDLLHPSHLVQQVHGITLAGGSAWGLDAASGAARWLEEQGAGLDVGVARIPLVPAAVLFDLGLGDARVRPDAAAGYAACQAASTQRPAEGSVGAGAGALVGKILGPERAMKGGMGTASFTVDGVTVGAIIACNAVGDVYHPRTGALLAGCRTDDGRQPLGARDALLGGMAARPLLAGSNTTIGVIATDAPLTKARAHRLAGAGHDGLARAIRPVHTLSDGDTLFALATGHAPAIDFNVLCAMAGDAVQRACVAAVRSAQGLRVGDHEWPAAGDLT